MARLTEEMVIARSKQSDLAAIKKLNCWGAELGDVSLLREMPNVEVLALSLNKIQTLVDFAWCERLRELYVRKNDIHDLREIRHLRRLPALTSLWLDENPCTDFPEYRMTVLRNLPQLERLDNLPVNPEEVSEASRRGALIPDSDEEDDVCQEAPDPEEYRQPSPELEAPVEHEPVERRDPDWGEDRWEPRETDRQYREPRDQAERESVDRRELREPEPDWRDDRRDQEWERRDLSDRRDPREPVERREPPLERRDPVERRDPAERRDPVERRDPAERRDPVERRDPLLERRDPVERREQCRASSAMTRSYYGGASFPRVEGPLRHSMSAHSVQDPLAEGERHDRIAEVSRCPCMCERRRRPTGRNSNLLSAVLCLVKELDYPSLEVLELAVRCRMDELASHQ